MKHLSLILLLLFSATCWGTEITGHMNCTVKSQRIVEIAEGITKEFTRFKDKYTVGDTLRFEYEYSLTGTPDLYLRLYDEKRGDKLMVSYQTLEDLDERSDDEHMYFHDRRFGAVMSFGRDYIEQETVIAELVFRRYYKSDWQGMYTRRLKPLRSPGEDGFASDMAQIATLACRHGDDRIDDILSKYAETLKTLKTKE